MRHLSPLDYRLLPGDESKAGGKRGPYGPNRNTRGIRALRRFWEADVPIVDVTPRMTDNQTPLGVYRSLRKARRSLVSLGEEWATQVEVSGSGWSRVPGKQYAAPKTVTLTRKDR